MHNKKIIPAGALKAFSAELRKWQGHNGAPASKVGKEIGAPPFRVGRGIGTPPLAVGKRIVFTNGVFDILHAGHVDYLTRAKRLGDILIIGINTDASARMNKGKNRPIVPYKYRAQLLAALEAVDYVVPLVEKTPEKLIELIRPDVLVKGAEYKVSEIVGADFVKRCGGKVVRMKMIDGLSTSGILSRIGRLTRP